MIPHDEDPNDAEDPNNAEDPKDAEDPNDADAEDSNESGNDDDETWEPMPGQSVHESDGESSENDDTPTDVSNPLPAKVAGKKCSKKCKFACGDRFTELQLNSIKETFGQLKTKE